MIKEKTINRILHWQHVDGTWIPYSSEELTRRLEKQEQCLNQIKGALNAEMPAMMQKQAL